MKKILILVLMLAVSPLLAQNKTDKDVAAIKALIEKETTSFFGINKTAWEECWHKTSYTFWSFADTTDVNSLSGWDNIRDGFSNYFKTAKPSNAVITRKWLEIIPYGTAAYARFIQQVEDGTNRPPQQEVRVLEKVAGQWKIVCVTVIAIEKENAPRR